MALKRLRPELAEVEAVASANTYNYNGNNYDITIIRKNNKNTYLRVKDSKIIVESFFAVYEDITDYGEIEEPKVGEENV